MKSKLSEAIESLYKYTEKNKNLSKFYNDLKEPLKNLHQKAKEIRKSLKNGVVNKFSDEEFEKKCNEFEELTKKYDKFKTQKLTEDEEKELEEHSSGDKISYVELLLSIQTTFTRISNIINTEKTSRLMKEYEKKLSDLTSENEKFVKFQNEFSTFQDEFNAFSQNFKEFKNETKNIKESILTITSIIFVAFTVIQLNFVAFHQTNTYSVYDRLLLFCGINIFVIIAIYIIMSMIKSIITQESKVDKLLKKRICLPIGMLMILMIVILYMIKKENKARTDEICEVIENINNSKLLPKQYLQLESKYLKEE